MVGVGLRRRGKGEKKERSTVDGIKLITKLIPALILNIPQVH